MTRFHALLLLCLAPPTLACEGWIGRTVPPYPEGLEANIGACVGSGPSPDEICMYSIATLDDAGVVVAICTPAAPQSGRARSRDG